MTLYLSGSEALDDIVTLSLGPLRVDDIDVQPIVDQFMEQLLGTLYALNENEHGRSKTLQSKTEELPLKLYRS